MNKTILSFAPAIISLVCVLIALVVTVRAKAGPFVAITGDSQSHTSCLATSADTANNHWDFLVDTRHPQDFMDAKQTHENNLSNIGAAFNTSIALAGALAVTNPAGAALAIAAAEAARRDSRAKEYGRYNTVVQVTLPGKHNTQKSQVKVNFYSRNTRCAQAEAARQAWDMDPFAIDQLMKHFNYSLFGKVFFNPPPVTKKVTFEQVQKQ